MTYDIRHRYSILLFFEEDIYVW